MKMQAGAVYRVVSVRDSLHCKTTRTFCLNENLPGGENTEANAIGSCPALSHRLLSSTSASDHQPCLLLKARQPALATFHSQTTGSWEHRGQRFKGNITSSDFIPTLCFTMLTSWVNRLLNKNQWCYLFKCFTKMNTIIFKDTTEFALKKTCNSLYHIFANSQEVLHNL